MLSLNRAKLLFFILSLPLFISILVPKAAASSQILYDNFTGIDEQRWTLNHNQGSISIFEDNYLHLESGLSQTSPYVYSETLTNDEPVYEIATRFKMEGPLNYGAGIAFSDELMQNQTVVDLTPHDVIFFVWPESPSTYNLWTTLCPTNEEGCSGNSYRKISTFSSGQYNLLHIKRTEESYEVNLNEEAKSYFSLDRDIKYIWIGNPQKTNTSTQRPAIFIDYIEITKEHIDTLENIPTIILPGFGGSWDLNAILSGNSGNNWQIPEFIKEYDGIINSLKNAGYTENQDLFIFPYDWRKPLDNLADDLNEFIANNSLEDKQINLVGHSMGGLVARSYTQKYNNPNINKVVTAGSPHKGIVDAYGMWEGLTVWDAVWWQKVLVGIASEMDRNQGETRLDAVRRFAPSIKDLLPTDNFLINAGIPVSISNMAWKNDYLLAQNSNLGGFLQKIFAGASADKANTKDKINVTNPSKSDQLRGLWQDGKPNQTDTFLYTIGDGYVNHNSAQSLFTNTLNLEGWHGETISKKENIIKILSELNIATESAVGSVFDNRKNVLIFKLNSPGKIDVCFGAVCNEDLGLIFENEKMILVPGYSEGNYSVKVNANNETGSYQLLVGELKDENTWQTQQGNLLTSNQLDIYQYDTSADQITASPETIARNNNIFWPTGIDQKKINETRQKILLDIDENIRNGHYEMFDTNIAKWKALDTFVVSLSSLKKGFTHAGWDKSSKSAVKSKYLGSSASYFTDRLVELFIATDASYRNTPKNLFTKQDKQIQTIMLKIFIGL